MIRAIKEAAVRHRQPVGTMSDLNLAQLTRLFYTRLEGPRAERIIEQGRRYKGRRRNRKKEGNDLGWLLRHHDEGAITDSETWERDRIDYLLAYYGILEIALLSGVVQKLPAPLEAGVLRNVSNVYVRRYYEQNYPILLPQLILRRLTGDLTLTEKKCTMGAFMDFNTLTHRFETDPNLETFLWFLDGGSRAGYDFDDVTHALAHPKRFAKEIDVPKRNLSELGSALHGFQKFLMFAVHFHEMIEQNLHAPLFAAAMYHAQGYWFDHLADKLGSNIGKAADAAIGPLGKKNSQPSRVQIRRAAKAVADLCERDYGKPLTDLHPMFATREEI